MVSGCLANVNPPTLLLLPRLHMKNKNHVSENTGVQRVHEAEDPTEDHLSSVLQEAEQTLCKPPGHGGCRDPINSSLSTNMCVPTRKTRRSETDPARASRGSDSLAVN